LIKFLALIAFFVVLLSVNSFAGPPFTLTGLVASNEEIDPATGNAISTVIMECYDGDGVRVTTQAVELNFYNQTGELISTINGSCSSSNLTSSAITESGLYYVVAELPVGSQCAKTGGCKQKAWFSITKPFVQMNVPDNNAFLAIAVAFSVLFVASKK